MYIRRIRLIWVRRYYFGLLFPWSNVQMKGKDFKYLYGVGSSALGKLTNNCRKKEKEKKTVRKLISSSRIFEVVSWKWQWTAFPQVLISRCSVKFFFFFGTERRERIVLIIMRSLQVKTLVYLSHSAQKETTTSKSRSSDREKHVKSNTALFFQNDWINILLRCRCFLFCLSCHAARSLLKSSQRYCHFSFVSFLSFSLSLSFSFI